MSTCYLYIFFILGVLNKAIKNISNHYYINITNSIN